EALRQVLINQNKGLLEKLTPREIDIIKLVVEGFNNKEIADKLFLSRHTIEGYRKNIRLKLNIKRSTDLIAFAQKVGFK
ncbi:MAG: response regulator transcription factor, partial [Chitinophagaceae bacterium]